MEKGKPKATSDIAVALSKFNLEPPPRTIPPPCSSSSSAHGSVFSRKNPRRLVSLCLGVLGQHFEDVVDHLAEISVILPTNIKPNIDAESKETLAVECPRIVVNPLPSPLSLRGTEVPHGALPGVALDGPYVEDVDPKAWAASYAPRVNMIPVLSDDKHELSKAEKFRLAFVERDLRLAPKRAKNVRQHQRRAEREWAMSSADAKSVALASKFRQNRI